MNIEEISSLCNSLKAVTSDVKWENHLCFNVGGKMFFIVSLDHVPTTASFKVSDEDFDYLTSLEGLIPAPYLARYMWVHIDDISRFSANLWEDYIRKSYALVVAKLPKKLKVQLEDPD